MPLTSHNTTPHPKSRWSTSNLCGTFFQSHASMPRHSPFHYRRVTCQRSIISVINPNCCQIQNLLRTPRRILLEWFRQHVQSDFIISFAHSLRNSSMSYPSKLGLHGSSMIFHSKLCPGSGPGPLSASLSLRLRPRLAETSQVSWSSAVSLTHPATLQT
jgi:hypothetical protein